MAEAVMAFHKSVRIVDRLGRRALHRAAILNSVPQIRYLLFLGADVNARDDFDQTPLHLAASQNKHDSCYVSIGVLLSSGADVNAQDRAGDTPLHNLIETTGINTLRLLLNCKPNVNMENFRCETPLLKSFNNRSEEIVEMLVNYGADVNFVNRYIQLTPLRCAWDRYDDMKIIKILLQNGADIRTLNFDEKPPTVTSFFRFRRTEEKLKFLLTYFNVNAIDSEKRNILHRYKMDETSWKIILRHLAKMQALKLHINRDIFETILSRAEFNSFYQKCADELSQAKVTKLKKNSWVTFFDLLVGSKTKLKNYARNEDLIREFQSSKCLMKYPIYGMEMQERVIKGIMRRELFDRSSILLSYYLPIFSPNHLIIKDVFDFIKTKDLFKFCQ